MKKTTRRSPRDGRAESAPGPVRLSPGEMEMLHMLWDAGAVTLSAAQRALGRPIGYTTVQTRLNRLVAKGLAHRSPQRPARYRAAVEREAVAAGHLELLIERVTEGSVVPLVTHLVREATLSAEEVAELKQLILEAERRCRQTSRSGTTPA